MSEACSQYDLGQVSLNLMGATTSSLKNFRLPIFVCGQVWSVESSKLNLNPELQEACNLRLDTVARILPELGQTLVVWQRADLDIKTKSNHMDLVTRADLESERRLKDCIQAAFAGDEILAEESGLQKARTTDSAVGSGFRWALDPVDGTINYAHGLPLFAVSIGMYFTYFASSFD